MQTSRKITLLLFVIFIFSSLLYCQDTIIDTLNSITYLEACVFYNTQWNFFGGGVLIPGETSLAVGDGYDNYIGGDYFNRSFFSFPIQNTPEDHEIITVSFYVNLVNFCGNGEIGIWPIWDLNNQQINYPCIVDHVDYGNTFELEDFFCPVLHPNVCQIDSTLITGYCQLDITDSYLWDHESGRTKSQYRFKFPVDTDYDGLIDQIIIASSYTSEFFRPFVKIVYESVNEVENDEIIPTVLLSVYPNPFNPSSGSSRSKHTGRSPETTISFSILEDQKIDLSIYNLKGQKVKTFYKELIEAGDHQILWNGKDANNRNVPSGIYFFKLKTKDNNYVKKMILLN